MLSSVQVEQRADHSLVLRMMPLRFLLEEVDTGLAQPDCDLDLLFAEREGRGGRKGVPHHLDVADGAVSVCDFLAHIFSSPSANIRHQ